MKKILLIILALLLVGCTAASIDKKISFETDEINLEIIESLKLPIILEKINENDIEYVIEDNSILTIEDGIILPLEIGSTTITAIYKKDDKIFAMMKVNVTPELPKIRIPEAMIIGSFTKLLVTNMGSNSDFTWEIADPSIVNLDETYTLTAIKVGITTITVTHKENNALTVTLPIEVLDKAPMLFASNQRLQPNDQVQLSILNLDGKTNNDFIWTIDDEEIISIDSNFILTAKKVGKATVTVTSKKDPRLTNSLEFEIGNAVINPNGEVTTGPLYLKAENIEAKVKAGEAINIEIIGAKDKYQYRWFSSDATVVAATDQGVIWGIKEGQSTITVYSKADQTVRGTITVTVYGTPNVDYAQRIVDVALSQEGYEAGYRQSNKFGDWFLYNNVDWCAIFVSWAANQAGIGVDVVHKYSLVSDGVRWFKERGLYKARGEYTPKKGDIIFFTNASGPSHVGIVVRSDSTYVYTIEGNTSNGVHQRTYRLTDTYILGYGVPNYPPFDPNL